MKLVKLMNLRDSMMSTTINCEWFDETFITISAYLNEKYKTSPIRFTPELVKSIHSECVKICRDQVSELSRKLLNGDLETNVKLTEQMKSINTQITSVSVALR